MKGQETVNHPKHYNEHPSGVECIDIVEHMGFNLGNAIKYLWRADLKGNVVEDLEKAAWYVQREIKRCQGLSKQLEFGPNLDLNLDRSAHDVFAPRKYSFPKSPLPLNYKDKSMEENQC